MKKTVLILGASSDIGWALAEKLRDQQFDLLLGVRNPSSLEERLKAWSAPQSKQCSIYQFDALDFPNHKGWFLQLPVVPDITICVFGYLGDQDKAESDWVESKCIIESNYVGAVSILNVVAQVYSERNAGTIVGISSVAGERGRQSNFIYGSAKAGLSTYLSGLRNKLYKNDVHVLTVKPGFVNTKMTQGLNLPKALTATPDQVAARVMSAITSKKNVVYVLPVWFWIMLIIKSIPELVFKRLKL